MLTFKELANAIRFLSIDSIQKANSGHPGMPLGMADIATVLWRDFLRFDPNQPTWANRDRFIISNGHGSMLLYSLLHLTGYDLTIDDLKNFRQLHSRTPGHPEYGCALGVETTTGPLGQGLANAVGMALAEKILAAQFNRPTYNLVDHFTYVFVGDGCLMEGVSHEACALAGTHGLGKLIVFWDNNKISIDGDVKNWFTDDTVKRFTAYNWHVIPDVNGQDKQAISKAITAAQEIQDKPTLICCRTTIGYGSPNLAGSAKTHGSPLGAAEIAATRKNLNWPYPPFNIPGEIYRAWDAREKGKKAFAEWQQLFENYTREHPELAAEFSRRKDKQFPKIWPKVAEKFIEQITTGSQEAIATRKASQQCLENYSPVLPELLGGSADLTESNLTDWSGSTDITKENALGNYLHYGVREFGMSAIMNGISLHGGFIPYGGTFLVFSDYCRAAIRLAAMMQIRVIFVLTHDSIGLGEDGPTHQPVEHLTMLRATPNLSVWRPCDLLETAVAWRYAIENQHSPTCLVLTRQKVPPIEHHAVDSDSIKRGAYVALDCSAKIPEAIIIATGSEVHLAVAAARQLNQQGRKIRVVSMPSSDVFDRQDQEYKEEVLPAAVTARLAVEAGACDFWYKYVGLAGRIIGLDGFGESAPAEAIFQDRGIKVENILATVSQLICMN